MKFKNMLSLMIALQMVLSTSAWGNRYDKAAERITKEFEQLGMKDASLKIFPAKSADGQPINGLVVAGSKFDGKILLQGTKTENLMKEWNTIKKVVRQEAAEAAVRAQNRKNIVHGLLGGSPPMKDVVMKMGPETLSFFVALGTIQYAKMIFDPGMNPLGTYQQAESQLHPITHISFAAFMYANGAIVPILQSILKPTNFLHKYISYMGMSAGLLASDTTHEISAVMDGKLERCVADLNSQVDKFEEIAESCDKAFETWAQYPVDFVLSLVPAVASLIGSFVLTLPFENMVKARLMKAGKDHLIRSIPIVGPISMALHGKRLLVYTLSNTIPFTVSSELLDEPIAGTMKTYAASTEMKHLQREMMYDLTRASASGWSDETAKQATERVYKASMLMKKWRRYNLEKIQAVYSAWLAKVGKMSSQYNISEFIYEQFITMTEQEAKRTSYQFLMRRPAPLYGITQFVAEGQKGDSEFENPRNVMLRQLQHIVKVTQDFNRDYNALKASEFNLLGLTPSQDKSEEDEGRMAKAIFKLVEDNRKASKNEGKGASSLTLSEEASRSVTAVAEVSRKLNALATRALTLGSVSDVEEFFKVCNQIGNLFEELNSQVGYKSYYPGLHPGSTEVDFETRLRAGRSTEQIGKERASVDFKRSFRNLFGNPFPIKQPGGLFFAALEDRTEVRSNSLLLRPIQSVDEMVTLAPAQKIFTDMFMGPSSGSQQEVFEAHSLNLGFTKFGHDVSSMNPPRLLQTVPDLKFLHNEAVKNGKGVGYPTLLNTPVSSGKSVYNNFYDYALQTWQESFVVKSSKEFKEFWKKNLLTGYQTAWQELQPFYEHFVERLYEKLKSKEKSISNTGPIHEGNLAQIDLEKKLYLMVFGEVLRSLRLDPNAYGPKVDFTKLNAKALGEKYLESGPLQRTNEASGDRIQILESLDINRSLVLYDHFQQAPDSKYPGWKERFPGQNLRAQNVILAYFDEMTRFISAVEFKPTGSARRNSQISSPFTNKQIIAKRDEVQAKLTAWKDLTEEPIPGVKAQLQGQKLRAYKLSLTALKLLVAELGDYALMANELSFYRSDGNPGRAGVQDPECMKEAAGMKMSGGVAKAQFNSKCAGGASGMNSEQKK
jgi:hypothetical protein